MNRVTLYSNGTGVFDRVYRLRNRQPLALSIPIRNDSLDEAIASIGVFGEVTLTEPPSYTPIGSATANLDIDPTNVTRDLATRMRGAKVMLRVGVENVSGRMAGIQTFTEAAGDIAIERFRIVLLDDEGAFRTFADREITALRFMEESVQTEIDKSLQRAYETIKPNSTFVNLTLAPDADGEVEARVQYAVAQLGAWKISYRLRGIEGEWELEGQAIVDNSTDEPWDNVLVSVVSGANISFSTDIAEIRPVRRNRVNVVADQAIDAVAAADLVPQLEGAFGTMDFTTVAAGAPAQMRAAAAPAMLAVKELNSPRRPAHQEQAQIREIGDAVEYTAPLPVTIGANRSAIIPMFAMKLPEAKHLLLYKPARNAERAYRALRFKNASEHPLGHGVCTLFQDGTYVGKAILESCQPEEERTLPYAIETGVRLLREPGKFETRRTQVRITLGAAVEENVSQGLIRYRVRNHTSTASSLEIEHTFRLSDVRYHVHVSPAGDAVSAPIPDGIRITMDLPAKADLVVTVQETQVTEQRFMLAGQGYGLPWLRAVLVRDHPLTKDLAVQACLRLQGEVDAARRELSILETQVKAVLDEQERLKGLLQAGGHEGAANEWRTNLAHNERLIKEAKTARIPQMEAAVREAEQALEQALRALTLSWSEEVPAPN